MNKQAGFTLIELVVVIVILGILAATAVPRFINMSSEANTAAVQGVAGAISSASAINYGARSLPTPPASSTATTTLTCQTAAAALLQGGIPTGYTLDNATALVAGNNNCTVTGGGGAIATAVIIGVS